MKTLFTHAARTVVVAALFATGFASTSALADAPFAKEIGRAHV